LRRGWQEVDAWNDFAKEVRWVDAERAH